MDKKEDKKSIDVKVDEFLRELRNHEGAFKRKKLSKEEALEIIKNEGLYDYGMKIRND